MGFVPLQTNLTSLTRNRPWLRPSRLRPAATLASLLLSAVCAQAYSSRVTDACKTDYYQHCSQFSVGTEELRQCMRKVGEGLSTPCLVALVQEGEITKAEVDNFNARHKEGGDAAASKTAKVVPVSNDPSTEHAALGASDDSKTKKKKAGKLTKAVGASKLATKTSKAGKTTKIAGSEKIKKTKIASSGEAAASVGAPKKSTSTKAKKVAGTGKTKIRGQAQQLAVADKPKKSKTSDPSSEK